VGILFYLCPSFRLSFRPSQYIFRRNKTESYYYLSWLDKLKCYWKKWEMKTRKMHAPARTPKSSNKVNCELMLTFYLCPSFRLSFRPSQYIFRRIFLSNYWLQKSFISWEAFMDPSDSYFLFAEQLNKSWMKLNVLGKEWFLLLVRQSVLLNEVFQNKLVINLHKCKWQAVYTP
jgi:hypothetical protein